MNAIAHTDSHSQPLAAASEATSRAASVPPAPSKRMLWTGRVLSGITVAFLTFDAAIKVLELPMVVKGTVELGYPPGVIVPLGLILLASVVLYVIPRTAALGALLVTGYLGGAIATHVRLDHPLFSHTLFPVYVAALLWAGLCLRNPKVRAAFSL